MRDETTTKNMNKKKIVCKNELKNHNTVDIAVINAGKTKKI